MTSTRQNELLKNISALINTVITHDFSRTPDTWKRGGGPQVVLAQYNEMSCFIAICYRNSSIEGQARDMPLGK